MPRILSLDDDPGILALLKAIFDICGYQALQTTDEDEALSILRTQGIDLFTQDFMRPGLGGVKFLQLLKLEAFFRDIPVLAISAGDKDLRTRQLKQFGLDIDRDLAGYLKKPFTGADLLDTVESVLEKQGKPAPPETASCTEIRTRWKT